jgi:hypothetical protein
MGSLDQVLQRSAHGQESTKCREWDCEAQGVCRDILLKESLSPNFVRDSEFARSASESISGETMTKNQQEGRNMLKVQSDG